MDVISRNSALFASPRCNAFLSPKRSEERRENLTQPHQVVVLKKSSQRNVVKGMKCRNSDLSSRHLHEADFSDRRAIRLFLLRADIDQLEQFLVPQVAADFDLNAIVQDIVFAKDRPQSFRDSRQRSPKNAGLVATIHDRLRLWPIVLYFFLIALQAI